MKPPAIGDYVLATKYTDGDPGDHWALGFFTGMNRNGDRFIVCDDSGMPFRANGFRRIKKISAERGAWMLRNAQRIEMSDRSVWGWFRAKYPTEGMP